MVRYNQVVDDRHVCALMCALVQPSMEPVPGRRGPRGRPAADVAAIGGDHAYETTQRLIGEELRKARKAKGWSQTQLAEAIGASRFMVIRLEAGTSDLRKEIAERIEAALECSGLVDLIDRRDQLVDSDGWSDRDSVMRRLLRTPRLQTVRIVLADDLDLYELLVDNPAVGDARRCRPQRAGLRAIGPRGQELRPAGLDPARPARAAPLHHRFHDLAGDTGRHGVSHREGRAPAAAEDQARRRRR